MTSRQAGNPPESCPGNLPQIAYCIYFPLLRCPLGCRSIHLREHSRGQCPSITSKQCPGGSNVPGWCPARTHRLTQFAAGICNCQRKVGSPRGTNICHDARFGSGMTKRAKAFHPSTDQRCSLTSPNLFEESPPFQPGRRGGDQAYRMRHHQTHKCFQAIWRPNV